ncbi:MAG: hypothetical protein HOM25_15295 [Rhodospirillaceae bacterium]|jgi:hypothetical protein|nr:hypothetical protein [Rhodospirillaceae bacterium]MBT5664157.1 hypothetical protein [Rhodospirillaceae bacterium]MBT5812146.1 hypothetical protein [Rhodospirillaceae bacterium]
MTRYLLTIGLPLAAPFVIYYVWWFFAKRKALAEIEGRKPSAWEELPWVWLVIAGCGLMAITLISLATIGIEGVDRAYIPPHFEDGKIVPGRME